MIYCFTGIELKSTYMLQASIEKCNHTKLRLRICFSKIIKANYLMFGLNIFKSTTERGGTISYVLVRQMNNPVGKTFS